MTDPTPLSSDPVSDTPKTDAAQVVAIYEGHGGLFVEAAFARDQERRIAELESLNATLERSNHRLRAKFDRSYP